MPIILVKLPIIIANWVYMLLIIFATGSVNSLYFVVASMTIKQLEPLQLSLLEYFSIAGSSFRTSCIHETLNEKSLCEKSTNMILERIDDTISHLCGVIVMLIASNLCTTLNYSMCWYIEGTCI